MQATVHPIDGVPGPQDNSWVDAVLTHLGTPAGALVARPLGVGPGAVVAFRSEDGDTAGFTAGPVTAGRGTGYRIESQRAGTATGPARYLQLTTFTGRSPEWTDAFDRSGAERIWPAVKDVPGLVGVLVGSTSDGAGRLVLTLAESVESLEAGAAAILSSALLPWEDPAHHTGPDGLAILRLLHADVSAAAVR
jgi:hypothetical protein